MNPNREQEPGTRNPERGTGDRVLLVGASTRAAADSAARAGFDVTTLDAYADLDQHPAVRALSTRRDFGMPFTATDAARLATDVPAEAVAYLSSFENHPSAVADLARSRMLLGNAPEVLRTVRDPFRVAAVLDRRGIRAPRCAHQADASTDWVLKPRRSGGGHGIRVWRPGMHVGDGSYLQERIEGIPASMVFVAANGRVSPLGMSVQLVGDAAFGTDGFRYCGNIMGREEVLFGTTGVFPRAAAAAATIAGAFGLVGVNGIDFIVADGEPLPIEVNPRWSASMELVERLSGVGVFAAHATACIDGALPEPTARPSTVAGKAIVYARAEVMMGDTRAWLDEPTVRDVPHPGERIDRGQPICTVFADGDSVATCHAALVARAGSIYSDVDRWQREAA